MSNLTRFLAATGALTLTFGALAAPIGTRNDGRRVVRLSETTEVLGAKVPPGAYDLRWTREPGTESVRLEVTRGKTVLASGKGSWTTANAPFPHEALVYVSSGGANELAEIRFRNTADWIRVDSRSAGAVATSDAPTNPDARR